MAVYNQWGDKIGRINRSGTNLIIQKNKTFVDLRVVLDSLTDEINIVSYLEQLETDLKTSNLDYKITFSVNEGNVATVNTSNDITNLVDNIYIWGYWRMWDIRHMHVNVEIDTITLQTYAKALTDINNLKVSLDSNNNKYDLRVSADHARRFDFANNGTGAM